MLVRIIQQQKKKILLLLVACCTVLLFGSGIYAVIVMKGVPQKIGLNDVEYAKLNPKLCGECHDPSMVDAHHNTKNAISGNCTFCHTASTKPGKIGVLISRNCMRCHVKSPHHKTKAALNKECTSCHDTPGLGDYSTKTPSYKKSKITPTTRSCRNCHADGVVNGKKVVGMKKTHHAISLKGCNTCHDEKDKKSGNIRICERCHNVKAIHEVLPHVEKANCKGCHGDKLVSAPAKKKK